MCCEIMSTNISSLPISYLLRRGRRQTLAIKLPFLVMIIKLVRTHVLLTWLSLLKVSARRGRGLRGRRGWRLLSLGTRGRGRGHSRWRATVSGVNTAHRPSMGGAELCCPLPARSFAAVAQTSALVSEPRPSVQLRKWTSAFEMEGRDDKNVRRRLLEHLSNWTRVDSRMRTGPLDRARPPSLRLEFGVAFRSSEHPWRLLPYSAAVATAQSPPERTSLAWRWRSW